MQASLKEVDGATAVTSTKTKRVVQVPQTLGLHGKGKPHTVSLPEKAGATLCGILKWDLTHCKESRGRAKFL